ncbi:MAG TPA: hypothetical protein VNM72_14020 [Blastocatellia bacterium]|nr:hypothetical protein [Blastocatellia bacterium]
MRKPWRPVIVAPVAFTLMVSATLLTPTEMFANTSTDFPDATFTNAYDITQAAISLV